MMKSKSIGVLAVALFAAAFVSCRTARPAGAPVAPLTASTAEEAMMQLRERRASFGGLRSLMSIRAITPGKTQSFRAQLVIHDERRMELIAYTPVGTTALTMSADGDRVSVKNHLQNSEMEGTAAALTRSLGFFGTELTPAEMAMLVSGIPPREDITYEVAPTGLSRASTGDVVVTFDPPIFPAQKVVVTRGDNRVEIEHLELVH